MRTKYISLLLILVLFAAGCSIFAPADAEPEIGQQQNTIDENHEEASPELQPVVAAEEIIISPSAISLDVNQPAQFTATVLPANATIKEVTWSSDNPSVATVTPTGLVTA